MAVERTLSIIKPDAVSKDVIGKIYTRFENAGLKIVAAQMRHLTRTEAEGFYDVHRARPFFKDLVDFMVSGPVMIAASIDANAVHGSDSVENAKTEIAYFFSEKNIHSR
jgi:nucleoside-diphosphate kinase